MDLIQTQNPDLVFSLWDTSYGSDINCWVDIIKPIADKIIAVIGNHDVMSSNLLDQNLEEFELEKPYYSFDYENVHVLVLDTQLELSVDTLESTAIINDTTADKQKKINEKKIR